jgi:uncharacterized RDD family membrane protein YckC
MDTSLKRILAYLIDIIIVAFIATKISNLNIVNPYLEKYKETYNKYIEIADSEDNSKEELINLNYDLYKYNTITSIIYITCQVLYFGVFAYFTNGQTVGKKLLKIRITSNNGKKLNILQLILRIAILNNLFLTLIDVIALYLVNSTIFYYITYIIVTLQELILSVNIVMVTLKSDHRGLHDIIAGTNVVEDSLSTVESEEVIEDEKPKKVSIKEKAERKNKKK